MEEKINITEILKEKPQGTKLHDLLYNVDVELDTISTTDTETVVWCTNETDNNTTCHRGYSEFGTVRGCPDGLQILLPSKEMRDWSKFAWKKGDILLSKDNDVYIIFEKFEDDAYTKFKGKHYFWKKLDEEDYSKEESQMLTSLFKKVNDNEAQSYINTIEERLGGRLNRETLEIEKKPEFKDGDVFFVRCEDDSFIEIFNYSKKNGDLYDHASLNTATQVLDISGRYRICKDEIVEIRLATDSEKQELFDALAKEGKAWNAEKKQIVDLKSKIDEQELFSALAKEGKARDAEKKEVVDLKPKIELKPFDKVLVRDGKNEIWEPAFFFRNLSHLNVYNYQTVGGESRVYCIPFNEETAKLIGTTDDWEG